MPILHVRNVADDLYAQLRERAAADRRTLGAEVVTLLERALRQPQSYIPAEHAEFFARIENRAKMLGETRGPFPDSVAEIRADREREE